ncbi:MAG TPA: hypothetical protein VN258_20295 [Mobilitalea sp.]|nr:hypothetical protein [Mobilitalea sp.]
MSHGSRCNDPNFVRNMCRFIGETVTVFTTSGGASGCGFTGVLVFVDCNIIRLVTDIGAAPTNPLSSVICSDFDDDMSLRDCRGSSRSNESFRSSDSFRSSRRSNRRSRQVGSVVDIPVDRIAAFCHNAIG